jgi:hypothetical protein
MNAVVAWARRRILETPPVRVLVLLILIIGLPLQEARRLTSLGEYDIWWHLRTGAWILQNHALPRSGLFSQAADQPWIAYSWGFEIVAAAIDKRLGLAGIPLLLMCLQALLAVVVLALAGISPRRFWLAAVLAALGLYALPSLNVRPVFLSMILFGLVLVLLFGSRRTGALRRLAWLPVIFALWANLHIQFVYGLLALGIFCAASLLERPRRLPAAVALALFLACCLATLIGPYTYHLYEVVWSYARSTATYVYVIEMHSMSFRQPEHYVRLLLTAAAFFVLGRRPSPDLFGIALMTVGAVVGFHMQRDAWFVVMPAVAVVAEGWVDARGGEAGGAAPGRGWGWERAVAAVLAIATIGLAAARSVPSSSEALLRRVDEAFPVRACDFIRENHLSPPLYNPFNWGGFIIWYLPDYPVAIDGRTDLYGDETVARQHKVLDGEVAPWDEPTFAGARTLLLHRYSWLGGALARAPGYQVVYRDERAIVLVRQAQ